VTTITVEREFDGVHGFEAEEIEIEVYCNVFPGEMERTDSPGCPPTCEFLSAYVGDEPFDLTAEEKTLAEEAYMSDLLDARVCCD
jgi:hypothetical protein